MAPAPLPPDITVITPILNGREHVEACLDSTARLAGRGLRVEHIVVDGGSTDGTLDLLNARSGVSVHVRRGEKAHQACNFGIEQTQGRAVAFLMVDDVWSEEAGAAFARALSRDDWDIALYSAELTQNGDSTRLPGPMTLWNIVRRYPGLNSALLAAPLAKSLRFDLRFPHANDSLLMIDAIARSKRAIVEDVVVSRMLAHEGSRTLGESRDVRALKYEINQLATDLCARPHRGVARNVLNLWNLHSALTLSGDPVLAAMRGQTRINASVRYRAAYPSVTGMLPAVAGLADVLLQADALFRPVAGTLHDVRASELGLALPA